MLRILIQCESAFLKLQATEGGNVELSLFPPLLTTGSIRSQTHPCPSQTFWVRCNGGCCSFKTGHGPSLILQVRDLPGKPEPRPAGGTNNTSKASLPAREFGELQQEGLILFTQPRQEADPFPAQPWCTCPLAGLGTCSYRQDSTHTQETWHCHFIPDVCWIWPKIKTWGKWTTGVFITLRINNLGRGGGLLWVYQAKKWLLLLFLLHFLWLALGDAIMVVQENFSTF